MARATAIIVLLTVPADRVESRASAPPLWAGLTPGVFAVGYRVVQGQRSIHVWYPTADTGRHLRFREYSGRGESRLASFLRAAGISSATVDSLFQSELFAVHSARPLERPFPLVLLAQGNGHDAVDQAVLSEYLASHGFIVVSTPSPMLEIPMRSEDEIGAFAESQASELLAAIPLIAATTPTDTSRIVAVGHSFGARAALLVTMRNRHVRGVVSLDGGIGTATGIEALKTAPSFRAAAELPPILHVYGELDAFMKPDFGFLKRLDIAELELVRTRAMRHAHFTTYGPAAAVFHDLAAATRASMETSAEVRTTLERTLRFVQQRTTNTVLPFPH